MAKDGDKIGSRGPKGPNNYFENFYYDHENPEMRDPYAIVQNVSKELRQSFESLGETRGPVMDAVRNEFENGAQKAERFLQHRAEEVKVLQGKIAEISEKMLQAERHALGINTKIGEAEGRAADAPSLEAHQIVEKEIKALQEQADGAKRHLNGLKAERLGLEEESRKNTSVFKVNSGLKSEEIPGAIRDVSEILEHHSHEIDPVGLVILLDTAHASTQIINRAVEAKRDMAAAEKLHDALDEAKPFIAGSATYATLRMMANDLHKKPEFRNNKGENLSKIADECSGLINEHLEGARDLVEKGTDLTAIRDELVFEFEEDIAEKLAEHFPGFKEKAPKSVADLPKQAEIHPAFENVAGAIIEAKGKLAQKSTSPVVERRELAKALHENCEGDVGALKKTFGIRDENADPQSHVMQSNSKIKSAARSINDGSPIRDVLQNVMSPMRGGI